MKLHNDKNAFMHILNAVNERTGIRSDILVKRLLCYISFEGVI